MAKKISSKLLKKKIKSRQAKVAKHSSKLKKLQKMLKRK